MFDPCVNCKRRWRNQHSDCTVDCCAYRHYVEAEDKEYSQAVVFWCFVAMIVLLAIVVGMAGLRG